MSHESAAVFSHLPALPEIPSAVRRRPELIIPLVFLFKQKCLEFIDYGAPAELPAGLLPWMRTQLAEELTETQEINFNNLHENFRTVVPKLGFLSNETAIYWEKFREFPLPRTDEVLIVQRYTIGPLKQTEIFRQTKITLPLPVPDPFLIAVEPLNPREGHCYARLIKKYWKCFQLAASFDIQKGDFYKQVDQAEQMLSQLAESIDQVITAQTRTIPLGLSALRLLLCPYYLKTSEALITPLELSADRMGLVFPKL
ncbi:MAG: hypothetical protein KJ757_06390 [Planctomycetes bacterium]|nr:hypothetical protein [Planctomycetota bacterium]